MKLYEIVMNYLISSSNFSVRLPLTEATRELVRPRSPRSPLPLDSEHVRPQRELSPWIRGEGFCRTCCKWEASTFIAIAVFHPFFMCFFPQGGLVPSGFTLYLQVFRLEQVADFDGQVQRLNDSMCVFFLGWEPRLELWKTPGTWSASWFRFRPTFCCFLCLKKWHFVERNVRSKPNGPSSSRCRQADGVLVAFLKLPGLFASSCQVEAWWWWANWDFQEDFLDSSSRCQEGRLWKPV